MKLYADVDVAKFIKLGRLSWADHLARMHESQKQKRVLDEVIHKMNGRQTLR